MGQTWQRKKLILPKKIIKKCQILPRIVWCLRLKLEKREKVLSRDLSAHFLLCLVYFLSVMEFFPILKITRILNLMSPYPPLP